MYDVTMRLVRVTIVAVKMHVVLHILSVHVCVFSYATRKAHVSYCHLWHVFLHSTCHHHPITARFSAGKKLLNIICVF